MKILDVNNMLDAAQNSSMPHLDEHQTALEAAATVFALALAAHLGKSGSMTRRAGSNASAG